MAIYEITITQTAIVEKWEGEKWDTISEYVDEKTEKVLKKSGYTPKIKRHKEVNRTVYTQIIGDDDKDVFDVTRVIAAINGLQMPVKVSK